MDYAPFQRLTVWLFQVVVVWIVWWYLVYRICGVHVGSVTINNGIAFNNIKVHMRKFRVDIKSFRFRLWGNSKRLIVTELRFTKLSLSPEHDTTSGGAQAAPNLEDLSLIVFPSNKYLRFIVRKVTKLTSNVTVEFKNTCVIINERITKIAFAKLSSTSRRAKSSHHVVKFKFTLVASCVENNPIVPTPGELPLVVLDSMKLDFKVSLDTVSGALGAMKFKLITDEFKLAVFKLAKLFLAEIEEKLKATLDRKPDSHPHPSDADAEKEVEKRFKRALKVAHLIYSNVDEISILSQNIQILEIPFLTANFNKSFADYTNNLFPNTSLDLSIKSLNFNIAKMSKNSAGFHALFVSSRDNPLNFSNAFQILKVSHCKTNQIGDYISKSSTEILNIPNHSLNFKGNIFDQITRGEGFKNSIAEVFWASSSPILDIDSVVLASCFYNFVVFRKYLKLKRIEKRYQTLINIIVGGEESDDSELEATIAENGHTKDKTSLRARITKYLQDYYPNLDLKFIIEQPRIIIRHLNTLTSGIELVNFSYSSLNFSLSTTDDRDYHSICQILHPYCSYLKKAFTENDINSNVKSEVFCLEACSVTLEVLKNLRVKVLLELFRPNIDLTNFYIIIGIGEILTNLTNLTTSDLSAGSINLELNSLLMKYKRLLSSSASRKQSLGEPSLEDRIFRSLPEWLITLQVKLHHSEITVGSRSVLIPPDLLNKAKNTDLKSDFLSSGKEGDLRCSRLKIADLSLCLNNRFYDQKSFDFQSPSSSISAGTTASDEKTDFWSLEAVVENLGMDAMLDFDGTYSQLFHIPDFNLTLRSEQAKDVERVLHVDGNFESLAVDIGYSNLAVIVGTIYLLKQSLLNPIKLIKSKIQRDIGRFSSFDSTEQQKPQKSLLELVKLEIKAKKTDILFSLDGIYKLKFDLFQTRARLDHQHLSVHNKLLRILTESPTLKNSWSRLTCWDDLSFKCNLGEPSRLYCSSSAIALIHPHKHVIYKLFDSISITLKIVKHLVRNLKDGSKHASVVHPSASHARKFPTIEFNSKRLRFSMEDDPFESELGMIYQLGLIEQRKRLDLIDLFENKATTSRVLEEEIPEKFEQLENIISDSWIRKIKAYKATLNNEIVKNKKFLFGNEAKLDSKFQKDIQPFSIHAPLFTINMDQLNLTISPPHFALDKLPQFLHDFGKGVPFDTEYSLILPTYMDLRLNELRMHLRDYPLPLLFVPRNTKNRGAASVRMSGHLVIAEALATAKENLRTLEVSMLGKRKAPNKYYELQVEKTLSSVKLYADINIEFESEFPSRFVWGQSYQFGIQQVMLNFDQFSKPPVDPSSKLGFWDKLRLIVHGRFKIRCGTEANDGPLEVAFKGSRDPYNMFRTGTGFILSFKDNVLWTINEEESSRAFCIVRSDKVSFYIPNYASSRLVCWSRDSHQSNYLPSTDKFITSGHGYYLDGSSFDSGKRDFLELEKSVVEKTVVSLSGGVVFRVGFVLERAEGDDDVTEECRPHYDINLFNPKFCKEDHDSYAGFRSDYINMLISLDANQSESYNTIHLSPGVFAQFFQWWKLFAGNMQLPIRRGKMFGELKQSLKFSQHLKSNRFIFNLKSLFISHVYRDEENDDADDLTKCYGIRGKMDQFAVDLHQRKEQRIQVNKELERNKKIKKMNFHIGDVHLKGIDLRIILANIRSNIYTGNVTEKKATKISVFDDDEQWFDPRDYLEAFKPSLFGGACSVHIQPLMYANRFSYLRDTLIRARFKEHDIFYNETSASDLMRDLFESQQRVFLDRIEQLKKHMDASKSNKEVVGGLRSRIKALENELKDLVTLEDAYFMDKEEKDTQEHDNMKFHNKFFFIKMMLKWNNKNRNLLYKYFHFVNLHKFIKTYMSYESISAMEELIEKNKDLLGDNVSEASSVLRQLKKRKSGDSSKEMDTKDRLAQFNSILRDSAPNETIVEDYLIYIDSPQIQLQAEEQPNSVLLLATPSISCKILSVYEGSTDRSVVGIDELETRFGAIIEDANVLVFEKGKTETTKSFIFDNFCYGSTTNWPPWLGVEICRNSLLTTKENLIIENMSGMITYYQMKPLSGNITKIEDNDSANGDNVDVIKNKLRVDIPSIVVNSTASQYYSLYLIVMHLLLYAEPSNEKLQEKLAKLQFEIDFQDLNALMDRLKTLHFANRLFGLMSRNFSFRDQMDNEKLNEFLVLNQNIDDTQSQILLLMHSMFTGDIYRGDANKQPKTEWIINADEVILHMLEDDRSPILDIALAKGHFTRIVNEDDSNVNRITVNMLQSFTLLPNATYPSIIEPLFKPQSDEALLTVDWSMQRAVGGIKLIENFEIQSQPLCVRIDETSERKLFKFIFQSDLESIEDSPIVEVQKNHEAKQKGLEQANREPGQDVPEQQESEDDDKNAEARNVKFDKSNRSISSKKKKASTNSFSQTSSNDTHNDEKIDEMIARSNKYISINNLKLNPLSLSVSMKLQKGLKRILNVHDFVIDLPEIVIQKRIISPLELAVIFKNILTKTLMSHLGALIKNKLTPKDKASMNVHQRSMRQLKSYSEFVPMNELQQSQTEDTHAATVSD